MNLQGRKIEPTVGALLKFNMEKALNTVERTATDLKDTADRTVALHRLHNKLNEVTDQIGNEVAEQILTGQNAPYYVNEELVAQLRQVYTEIQKKQQKK